MVNKLASTASATTYRDMEVPADPSEPTPSANPKPVPHGLLGSHLEELQAVLSGSTCKLTPLQMVTRALHAVMSDCGMMDTVSTVFVAMVTRGGGRCYGYV